MAEELRDRIAIEVMKAILTREDLALASTKDMDVVLNNVALLSYHMARYMIKARG